MGTVGDDQESGIARKLKAVYSRFAGALQPLVDTFQQQWMRLSRMVVVVGIPATILYLCNGHSPPGSIWHNAAFVSAFQWFVITCVMVALPTIGKSTQKASERALGSFCGGILGLMFVLTESPWAKVLGALLAAVLGEYVIIEYKKEYTGRLVVMTYLIVASPAWITTGHPAWLAGVLRMAAVLAGIAWTFLVSLVWFPETSSDASFQQLLAMMRRLEGLGSNTWALLQQQQEHLLAIQPQQTTKQQQQQQQQSGDASQLPSSDTPQGKTITTTAPAAQHAVQASAADAARNMAASDLVAIHMGGASIGNESISLVAEQPTPLTHTGDTNNQRQQQQQQENQAQEQQQSEGDACDNDVREFIATRALLQDSLKAAAAERQLGWLCSRPVFLPSILLPGSSTGGCCPQQMRPSKSIKQQQGQAATDSNSSENTAKTSAGGVQQFLPAAQVRSVAIAQRHCVFVLWVLHKLLQDSFDRQALLAATRRYPADMLKDIQHDAQAVLAAATLCLESAIQHHQRWHPRQGSQGNTQLQQQLVELQSNMDSLHRHLTRWQEMFITLSQQRRETLLRMLESHEATAATHAPQPRDAAAHTSEPLPETTQYRQVHRGHLAMLTELFFITPTARESYIFLLQWHAMHYILQQLDTAFTELTGSLQELLRAMHGGGLAGSN